VTTSQPAGTQQDHTGRFVYHRSLDPDENRGVKVNKREFLGMSTAAAITAGCTARIDIDGGDSDSGDSDSGGSDTGLSSIVGDAQPIGVTERLQRVARAQQLMAENDIDALVLEPGSAMLYFSGVRWRRSERLTAVVIPREGDIGVVTPFFEEPSVRESMTFGDDVRAWHEHENPFEQIKGILRDRGYASGRIGLEETVRFFVVEGLREAAAEFAIVGALPVTMGCRMYKSANEIELMRKASEVTLRAYEHVYTSLDVGMTPADVNQLMREAQSALGGSGIWNMALFGPASAYPHGTSQPQEFATARLC
jgi:Xaa-Pro dipeptidase